MSPSLGGPKQSNWFKVSFMDNRFSGWLQIRARQGYFSRRYWDSLLSSGTTRTI